jgi:signal transduction histidine kinase
VDKGQLIGVLRSLIDNGIAAMPFGGTLEIAEENVDLEGKAKGVPLPAGKYIKIGISDQGRGVAEDSLERIFDPYFTPHQRKIGLAMASAYSVVKHHGGALTVSSRSGKGTRMNVFLPAAQVRSGAAGG